MMSMMAMVMAMIERCGRARQVSRKICPRKNTLKTFTLREVETYRWSSWLVEVDRYCPGSLLSWILIVLDPYCPWSTYIHVQHIYMSNIYTCLTYIQSIYNTHMSKNTVSFKKWTYIWTVYLFMGLKLINFQNDLIFWPVWGPEI